MIYNKNKRRFIYKTECDNIIIYRNITKSIWPIMSDKMGERLRRFSKISPSMGNAQFGYSICPKSDDEFSTPLPKTLAIPLSAIQTTPQRHGKITGYKDGSYICYNCCWLQ